jgi:hypothetical protein
MGGWSSKIIIPTRPALWGSPLGRVWQKAKIYQSEEASTLIKATALETKVEQTKMNKLYSQCLLRKFSFEFLSSSPTV